MIQQLLGGLSLRLGSGWLFHATRDTRRTFTHSPSGRAMGLVEPSTFVVGGWIPCDRRGLPLDDSTTYVEAMRKVLVNAARWEGAALHAEWLLAEGETMRDGVL